MGLNIGRRIDKAVAGAAVLAIGLSACSRAEAPKSTTDELMTENYAKPSSVCTLLAKSDLENVLGHRYESGTGQTEYDQKVNRRAGTGPEGFTLGAFPDIVGVTPCMYFSPDSNLAFVATGVATSLIPYVWKQVRGGSRVQGLGRQALWKPDRGQMVVLTEDKIFALLIGKELSENAAHHRERAVRLSRKALSRLRDQG